jgi:transposase-like protein
VAEADILAPSTRRRTWNAAEKAALLAEIDAEGCKVRLVARRHGIAESLLYKWRSARKAAAVAMGAAEDVAFIPAGVIAETRSPSPALLASACPAPRQPTVRAKSKAGSIEIVLVNGSRITVDAFVDEEALSRVLRAMRGLP